MYKKAGWIAGVLLSLEVNVAQAGLIFSASYNQSFDAETARGDRTATVTHDGGTYDDIELTADGQGKFTTSSPNRALHHDNGDAQHSHVVTGEHVAYSATNNFSFSAGSYVAWVKPIYAEGGFSPHDGYIICSGRNYSYSSSLVLDDVYYYSYNHDFRLMGTDPAGGSAKAYANVLMSGYGSDIWHLAIATWELVADGASSTGYRMDAAVYARRTGDGAFTSATKSTMNVSTNFGYSTLNVGSDFQGDYGYGGHIDNPQIYDHVLSAAEMEAIWNGREVIPPKGTAVMIR